MPQASHPKRRSVYADKLAAFADVAVGDDAVFGRRGAWREHFARRIGPAFAGRLVVEFGCFDAAFLCQVASRHPTTAFVGIDWKARAIHDGATRIAALGLRNVTLLRGRAQDVGRMFVAGEVDEAFVFHPEPAAAPRDRPHRLLDEPFLLDVHTALRDATSTLSIKTDHAGLYQCLSALFGLPEAESIRDAIAGRRPAATSPARAVRRRDLTAPADLPGPSTALRSSFVVRSASADFWHDPAALGSASTKPFAGMTTAYEGRFVAKRRAIFYLDLRKAFAANA